MLDLTPAADLLNGDEVENYADAGFMEIEMRGEMDGKTAKF